MAEFKKVKIKVTPKHVKDHYQFTEEEFEKFIKLSKRIDETKNMTKSVIAIWGDLKSAEERALKQDVAELKIFSEEQKHLIFVFGQCLSLPDTFFYLIFKDQ